MNREEVEKKLRALPPRLIVAFAARCGRRVQPLATAYWSMSNDNLDVKHRSSVNDALTVAQSYAAGVVSVAATTRATTRASAAAAAAAEEAEGDAAAAAAARAGKAAADADADADADAADAAARAARAARAAVDAVDADGAARAAHAFAHAFAHASLAAAANADIAVLVSLAEGGAETVDPTPSGPLGPYWPAGEEPDWWVEPGQEVTTGKEEPLEEPSIDVYLDPGGASSDTIAEVLKSLSNLHIAAGGAGLEFVADDLNVFSLEGVVQ